MGSIISVSIARLELFKEMFVIAALIHFILYPWLVFKIAYLIYIPNQDEQLCDKIKLLLGNLYQIGDDGVRTFSIDNNNNNNNKNHTGNALLLPSNSQAIEMRTSAIRNDNDNNNNKQNGNIQDNTRLQIRLNGNSMPGSITVLEHKVMAAHHDMIRYDTLNAEEMQYSSLDSNDMDFYNNSSWAANNRHVTGVTDFSLQSPKEDIDTVNDLNATTIVSPTNDENNENNENNEKKEIDFKLMLQESLSPPFTELPTIKDNKILTSNEITVHTNANKIKEKHMQILNIAKNIPIRMSMAPIESTRPVAINNSNNKSKEMLKMSRSVNDVQLNIPNNNNKNSENNNTDDKNNSNHDSNKKEIKKSNTDPLVLETTPESLIAKNKKGDFLTLPTTMDFDIFQQTESFVDNGQKSLLTQNHQHSRAFKLLDKFHTKINISQMLSSNDNKKRLLTPTNGDDNNCDNKSGVSGVSGISGISGGTLTLSTLGKHNNRHSNGLYKNFYSDDLLTNETKEEIDTIASQRFKSERNKHFIASRKEQCIFVMFLFLTFFITILLIVCGIYVFSECLDANENVMQFMLHTNYGVLRWDCVYSAEQSYYTPMVVLKHVIVNHHFEFISIYSLFFIFICSFFIGLYMLVMHGYKLFVCCNIVVITIYWISMNLLSTNKDHLGEFALLIQPWALAIYFVGLHKASRFAHF